MARQRPYEEPGQSCAILDQLRTIEAISLPSLRTRPSYPPVSSIPRTPPSRLAAPDASPSPFPAEPVPASSVPASTSPTSVLYLAYGSNLSAETFLGLRGIRPLSQLNVTAPSLRLVFDLPGLPYREPCFANTALRKLPKLPDPPKLPPDLPHPPIPPPHSSSSSSSPADDDPQWTQGLIGVVYEVTREDYARILATEGGGASYADILVPCLPLPPRLAVPEKPPLPELPRAFLAHTLCAPRLPGGGGEEDDDGKNDDGGGDDDDDDDKSWWSRLPPWARRWIGRLVTPVRRPRDDYAQPSARYLRLIRTGAREHELPDAYQAYLARLRPYAATRLRQRVGMALMLALFAPAVLLVVVAGALLADADTGRMPRWVAVAMTALLNLVWISYDAVFWPVFGDGERTETTTTEARGWDRTTGRPVGWSSGGPVVDDEEKRLLDE